MLKQLAELIINKNADYKSTIVKSLEKTGYSIVLVYESILEYKYIIAKEIEE